MPKRQDWSCAAYRVFWNSMDLLIPPVCAGCGKSGARWCGNYQKGLIPVPEPICDGCGLPKKENGICLSCKLAAPAYDKMRSWAVFDGPIRPALHHLMYRRDLGLGEALAHSMQFFVTGLRRDRDRVLPVPLSRQGLRERGYNQIALVAYPLAMQQGQNYSPKSLLRVKHTHSQVSLTREERRRNVSGAFTAISTIVAGRSIFLMDVVSTTGSTIVAVSEARKAAGAEKVYALTLARAVIHHGLEIA